MQVSCLDLHGNKSSFCSLFLRDIIHPAAAIQGHMTLKVGVVTNDHEFLSDLKCEGILSWRYEDMKHQHFYGPPVP